MLYSPPLCGALYSSIYSNYVPLCLQLLFPSIPVSCTKHIWYSEHGTYYRFEFILEQVMSVTHIAVILPTRTGPAYEEESMKTDYPDARNEYSMS